MCHFLSDEMKIKKDLICNKHTARLIGHVNLGNTGLNTGALKKYQMNFLDIL